MELFSDVKAVRLRGPHHGKYLWANDDRHSIIQKKDRQDKAVIWKVELVPEMNAIRLKSRYDLYLMASDYAFLLGATGKKVIQSRSSKADSSIEWEPIRTGNVLRFKTKNDTFLRANGGMPPWRNSVTHDVPVLANTQDSTFWEVEIVEKLVHGPVHTNSLPSSQPVEPQNPPPLPQSESSEEDDDLESEPLYTPKRQPQRPEQIPAHGTPRQEYGKDEDSPSPSVSSSSSPARVRIFENDDDDRYSKPSPRVQTPKPKSPLAVRRIFYSIAEDNGDVLAYDDGDWGSFLFKGHSLKDLAEQLQIETAIDDEIILCTRHPLSAKLYKMRLELPPNKAPMQIVVVRADSPFGRTFT